MQNDHIRFYSFLRGLPQGEEIVAAYREYKAANKASAFALNGHLKAGLGMSPELVALFAGLKRAICAQNQREIKLYRMTSQTEFSGPLLSAIERSPIRYPAFMSTSGDPGRLHTFTPPASDPALVLEITCPPGHFVGLMEAHAGASEDEYLFGCGTEFRVTQMPEVVDPSEAILYVGYGSRNQVVKRLRLSVHKSPPYCGIGPIFSF